MKLIEKKRIDTDIYQFTFKPEKPLGWKAGQQMVFTLNHPSPDNLGIRRTFSIATAPFEENVMIITHCGERSSTFKAALRNMKEEETIEAEEPEGEFTIQNPKKNYTFIASGVGISPFRSILTDLDYHNLAMNITLIYSHSSEHFPFKEELEELVERHRSFSVFYTIDPQEKERGRIKEVVNGLKDNPIYMSGIYIRKIAQILDLRDVTPKRVAHNNLTVSETIRQQEASDEESQLASMWGE